MIFLFVFGFQQFKYDTPTWEFLSCPGWWSSCFLNLWIVVFSQFLKILNSYLFKYYFCPIFSFLSIWNSNFIKVNPFHSVPFIFYPFFCVYSFLFLSLLPWGYLITPISHLLCICFYCLFFLLIFICFVLSLGLPNISQENLRNNLRF